MERLPERLASLNLASDSRRLAFLVLSPDEMAMQRWQAAGWLLGRNVFPKIQTPSKMVQEGWETYRWIRGKNVSRDPASDPGRPNGGASTSLVLVGRCWFETVYHLRVESSSNVYS